MFAASKTDSVSGGYQISRSLRFNSADSAYLNRTPASAGNRQIYTISTWVKRSTLSTFQHIISNLDGGANNGFDILFTNTNTLNIYDYTSGYAWQLETTQVFRDVSAWYHIVVAVDTTQATSSNRVKLYVNGTQVTTFTTATYPTLNYSSYWNNTSLAAIGRAGSYTASSGNYLDAYVTETYNIDGQALTPSSFGETNAQTGVWQPKAYSGSYGTNGFYLNFSDNSNTTAATLGKDYSGNGNNWTPNNFSVTAGAGNDSLVDSPTSYGTDTGVGGTVRGNYCTLNSVSARGATLTNGNLDASVTGDPNAAYGTIGVSSGKWYWEVLYASGNGAMIGIANTISSTAAWNNAFGWTYYFDGATYTNNTRTSGYGASYGTGSIVSVALDMDAGTLTFYVNGTSQGVAYSSLSGTMTPYLGNGGFTSVYSANFGQRPFAYTAPSGFKALCTQNLPTPTIGATTATQAGKFFNPVTYTGNGSSRSITGLGFQPDFTWIKDRSAGFYHRLADAVRGAGKELYSNDTGAETTNNANGYVTSFNSDGFSLGTGVGVNQNGTTYVAWNWKANGSGSTNTAGTITSTVSANTTSGFSVVTYTNASSGTVGHGLGVAPAMVIYKDRTNVTNWVVLHQSLTNMSNYYLKLNLTDAVATGITLGGNPTSSVIYTNTSIIQNSAASVAYCFAEVAGYSKFGSYTGNGSTDGPFVYTGFRPAYVMIKLSSAAGESWYVMDNKRNTANSETQLLFPNLSNAELSGSSGLYVDFNANGFKVRDSGSSFNSSGATYIFAAFAETPQKFSLAR